MDTRGRSLFGMGVAGLAPGATLSETGLKLEADGRVYPKGWDVQDTFSTAQGALTGYWQAGSNLIFAGRVGGQKVWGNYPWFEAAFIGGSDNVRGYGRNRFAGDSSAFANGQVMLSLFNMNLILPLRFGILGLVDTGRVWAEGENSTKWHPGYGGGIFLRVPATRVVFHGLLVHSDEGNHFYVNIGYGI
jgi:hemolysin activation/secretion protein